MSTILSLVILIKRILKKKNGGFFKEIVFFFGFNVEIHIGNTMITGTITCTLGKIKNHLRIFEGHFGVIATNYKAQI